MKRIIAILVVLSLLLVTFCGCKSNGEDDLNQVTGGVGGNLNVNAPGNSANDSNDDEPEQPGQTPNEEQPGQNNPPEDSSDEEPNEEQPGQNNPPEDSSDEEPNEKPKGPVDYTTDDWITICSYNVRAMYYDHEADYPGDPMSKFDAVCDELRKIDADVVGLQELYRFSKRCGEDVDQLKVLAKELDYPYYYFAKHMDDIPQFGGEYGVGVLSRYPITASKTDRFGQYDIDGDEPRSIARCELKVNNKTLVFYTAHLYETKGTYQMLHISLMMEKDMEKGKYAVLTGDMNYRPWQLIEGIDDSYCTMLNTEENPQNTVYQNALKGTVEPIDNIVVTNNLDYYWDEANKTGINVVMTSASDHLPIYTYVRMK